MPNMRKLSPSEVRTIEYRGASERKQIAAIYDEILSTFVPGDYGQVDIEPGERRMTVRNRLRAAAQRRGLALHFLRTGSDALRFRVEEGEAGEK